MKTYEIKGLLIILDNIKWIYKPYEGKKVCFRQDGKNEFKSFGYYIKIDGLEDEIAFDNQEEAFRIYNEIVKIIKE